MKGFVLSDLDPPILLSPPTSSPLPISAPTIHPEPQLPHRPSLADPQQASLTRVHEGTQLLGFFLVSVIHPFLKNLENMDNKRGKEQYSQPKPTTVDNLMFGLPLFYIYM